jgi:hypothetical protein
MSTLKQLAADNGAQGDYRVTRFAREKPTVTATMLRRMASTFPADTLARLEADVLHLAHASGLYSLRVTTSPASKPIEIPVPRRLRGGELERSGGRLWVRKGSWLVLWEDCDAPEGTPDLGGVFTAFQERAKYRPGTRVELDDLREVIVDLTSALLRGDQRYQLSGGHCVAKNMLPVLHGFRIGAPTVITYWPAGQAYEITQGASGAWVAEYNDAAT